MIRSILRNRAAGMHVGTASWLVIATVVVAGTLGLVAAEPAAAFTVTSHGSPGRVGVPPATLGYGDQGGVTEQLTAPARYIYESMPYAGRDQSVCITHRTWEYDGSGSFEINSHDVVGFAPLKRASPTAPTAQLFGQCPERGSPTTSW